MKRREFIGLIGGAAVAASCPARAQADRVRRVGVLMGYAQDDPDTQARMKAFREAFGQLGWKEGHNVQITYRFGVGEMDRIRGYARELVDLKPDAIVCETTPTLKAVADQTSIIPIVFVSVTDPVSNGFVTDLARPGGNITGFTNFEATMGGKWIELLKKIAPGSKRVGVIFNPATAPGGGGFFLKSVAASAPALQAEVLPFPVHDDGEIENAVRELAREPGGRPHRHARRLHPPCIARRSSRRPRPAGCRRYFPGGSGPPMADWYRTGSMWRTCTGGLRITSIAS